LHGDDDGDGVGDGTMAGLVVSKPILAGQLVIGEDEVEIFGGN
jgi:hypothetical protein